MQHTRQQQQPETPHVAAAVVTTAAPVTAVHAYPYGPQPHAIDLPLHGRGIRGHHVGVKAPLSATHTPHYTPIHPAPPPHAASQHLSHSAPLAAKAVLATASPYTPSNVMHAHAAYPAMAHAAPSTGLQFSRRASTSSAASSGGGGSGGGGANGTGSSEHIVMATVIDSGHGGTPNGPAHTPVRATAASSWAPVKQHPPQPAVMATVLEESNAHAHLALHSAGAVQPVSHHTQGQAVPYRGPVPLSVRVVTATIAPLTPTPPTLATAAVVATQYPHHRNGTATAAIVATPVHAVAAVPVASHSASRRPQRMRKRGGRAAGAGGSSRGKLNQPDPLDQVDDGGSITRCICGSAEDDGFMICCEGCSVWQHAECLGLRETDELPEEYWCDLCDPDAPLHVARRAEQARRHAHMLAVGGGSLAPDGKRRRKTKRRLTLGKKRRRRGSHSYSRNGGGGGDEDDEEMNDDDGSERSDTSGSQSGSEGEEEDDSEERDEEGYPISALNGGSSRRREIARQSKSATTHSASGGHGSRRNSKHGPALAAEFTSSPEIAPSASPSTFTSPAASPSGHHHLLLSPGSTAAVVALSGQHAGSATSPPTGSLESSSGANGAAAGGTGGSGSGAAGVPSPDITPAASPTGETKLRSLIFTMEQLANGQMTSPISTSASLSLSNLARYTYPTAPSPAPAGAAGTGSAVPSPAATPGATTGTGGAGGNALFALPLVRQVSENTANAAVALGTGFSAAPPSAAGGASTAVVAQSNPGSTTSNSHVVLEAFSPVLPHSLQTTVPTPGLQFHQMALPPSVFAHRPVSGSSLPQPNMSGFTTSAPAPAPAAVGQVVAASVVPLPPFSSSSASSSPPSGAPVTHVPTGDQLLLSPATASVVNTLTAAIPSSTAATRRAPVH